jgi:hypothetical protein
MMPCCCCIREACDEGLDDALLLLHQMPCCCCIREACDEGAAWRRAP